MIQKNTSETCPPFSWKRQKTSSEEEKKKQICGTETDSLMLNLLHKFKNEETHRPQFKKGFDRIVYVCYVHSGPMPTPLGVKL